MTTFDVLFTADLRRAHGACDELADDAQLLAEAGFQVGFVNTSKSAADAPFAGTIRDLLRRGTVQLVLGPDSAQARLVTVHEPEVFMGSQPRLPDISSEKVLVIADRSPKHGLSRRYDIDTVSERIRDTFGARPTWTPRNAPVRETLTAGSSGVQLTKYDWSDDDPEHRLARISELIGNDKTPKPPEPAEPHASPRRHGVLVIDLTGEDRPDTLLPAVRRETTDPQRPRVVVTSAEQAAEHLGDLAVEILPRSLAGLSRQERHAYLSRRIASLVQTHQPEDIVVIDDGRNAATVGSVEAGRQTRAWRVQPHGTDEVAVADEGLGKRIRSVLPPGWTVVPVATRQTGDANEPKPRNHRSGWLTRAWVAVRRRFTRRPSRPSVLIVAPDVHVDPAAAVRAIAVQQVAAGTFQAALLAPPDWEAAASGHGIRFESLIPEPTWLAIYGSGWRDYLRRRVRDAGEQFQPTAVVFAETFTSDAGVAMDVIDATADTAAR